jgi:type I restriction enzyme S subunit
MPGNSFLDSFKEAEIGPIPVDWDVVRLGEVADKPQYGYTASALEQPVGPKFLRITDIQEGRVSWSSVPFCRIDERGLAKYRLEPRDLLFARIGATTGKTYLVTECPPSVFASYLMRVRVKSERLLPEYAHYFTNTAVYWRQINASKGGRLKKGINIPILTSLLLPLPPLPEQRRIAHVLSAIQRAIAAQDDLIAAAREVKRSLMQRLFTYGPGPEPAPTKETEIGEIPEHWEVLRLEEIARIERGKFAHRPRNDPRFYGGTTPFIQTGDVANSGGRITSYSQTLNELGLSVSRVFPKGTIVITIAANIGYTGILGFDSAFPDSLIGITPASSMDNIFLEYYLQTQQSKMDALAPRGTQKNINIQFLRPWPVPKPQLTEQKEIADVLSAADRKIAAEEQRKAALQALFKAMLHQLMTGQLRLPKSER